MPNPANRRTAQAKLCARFFWHVSFSAQLFSLTLAAILLRPAAGAAQVPTARYWVTLQDKGAAQFEPRTYFAPEAQARRRRQHLPAFDATDRPVAPAYLARLAPLCDTITLVSRWFNAISCRATAAQAARLRALPFVRAVQAWPGAQVALAGRGEVAAAEAVAATETPALPAEIRPDDYRLARQQTLTLGARALARAGLDGRGLRIAIFDVGFTAVDRHPAFADLVREQRIVATYDFLNNRPDVFRGGVHGTEVLGCLAGRLPGGADAPYLGLAPAATYLLARTERLTGERYAEEEAWLAAAEWADKNGADLISSSLAYTEQRYFPEQMDGRHSLVARAAALAVRKGMLVVSAAGNDGEDDWRRIGTPADGDSVLAVGGLDPVSGLCAPFSSVGPSADRRVKPDVAAPGTVLTAVARGLRYARLEGTSFSAPLVAGLAACVWQQQRGLTAGELLRRLRQAGELYPYYDYAHGYGRPLVGRLLRQPSLSTSIPKPDPAPTFDFVVHDSLVAVVLRPAAADRPRPPLPLLADDEQLNEEKVETAGQAGVATPGAAQLILKLPAAPPIELYSDEGLAASGQGEPGNPAYLYWHLADRRGVLRRYEVRAVRQRLVVQLPRRLLRSGDVWRVHFQGYTGRYSE